MISTRVNLQQANTLGLPCIATAVADIRNLQDIKTALLYAAARQLRVVILGGGSNVLLPPTLNALVLRPGLHGISIQADAENWQVSIAAGKDWHQLVAQLLKQGVHGLENLALIPGRAGASVIQNIGAYGVEIGTFVETVAAYDLHKQQPVSLSRTQCGFAYRNSIFKQQPGRYLVLKVNLTLPKTAAPDTSYQALAEWLKQHQIQQPAPQDVFAAVVAIRQQKLPDPGKLANCGSFFKNPIVTAAKAAALQGRFSQLPVYNAAPGYKKLAAGWLIEQWRLEGQSPGRGCHAQPAGTGNGEPRRRNLPRCAGPATGRNRRSAGKIRHRTGTRTGGLIMPELLKPPGHAKRGLPCAKLQGRSIQSGVAE